MAITPEDLRYEVRRFLYSRPTASMPVDAIMHGLSRMGHDADASEITAACAFLEDLGQVKMSKASLGSTRYAQITAAGILAYERNE